jgi:phage gp36-like protein
MVSLTKVLNRLCCTIEKYLLGKGTLKGLPLEIN